MLIGLFGLNIDIKAICSMPFRSTMMYSLNKYLEWIDLHFINYCKRLSLNNFLLILDLEIVFHLRKDWVFFYTNLVTILVIMMYPISLVSLNQRLGKFKKKCFIA